MNVINRLLIQDKALRSRLGYVTSMSAAEIVSVRHFTDVPSSNYVLSLDDYCLFFVKPVDSILNRRLFGDQSILHHTSDSFFLRLICEDGSQSALVEFACADIS
jgi:hypothetical protein